MAKLPRDLQGRDEKRAWERDGWTSRGGGKHPWVLTKDGVNAHLTIYDKIVSVGVLRKHIRAAGLTVEEFLELLD